MTETEMEGWVRGESRELRMPDGTSRSHTALRLVWVTADRLVELHGYTLEQLVICTLETAELNGWDFARAFTNTIGMLEEHRRAFWAEHG